MATSYPAGADGAAVGFDQARRRRIHLRFAAFELDSARFELRRHGTGIPLAPQPFDLLWLLASRAGELVGREEIRGRLWGGATFVQFDGCVNFAVRVLRKALGDDARQPRFIQAVRGRGYRFIAAVDSVMDEGSATAL
jgi:DNA-binding winged helix-turn-helix (wHTH) protein